MNRATGGTTGRSDLELVQECRLRLPYDTAAFETLVSRYRDRVFSKALSLLKNAEDAEDVAQEIFIKVFHKLPSFRQDASFSTWLYAVTANTCLSHIDKSKRSPLRWMEDDIDEAQQSSREDESMFVVVGQGAGRSDLSRLIQRTLAGMAESSREILSLRFIEELDYQSIAAKLGIGLSAAKMRLKRAREEFRREYEQLTAG